MISTEITAIYENYLNDVDDATVADARHFGGLSRIFTGKRSDAERLVSVFDSKLGEALGRLYGPDSDSAEICELAGWMLDQAVAYGGEPQIKYTFMAVLRHLIPLSGRLSAEDASILSKKFEDAIPKRERFPIHIELMKKLRKLARG